MTDDITFCTADCAMKGECYRNPARIKEPQYPHSYADFSKDCMAYEPTEYPRCDINGTPFDECGFCEYFNCDTCKCDAPQTERSEE